jgi:hypothetical protein
MQNEIINHLIKQEKQLLDRADPLDVLVDLIDDEFIEVGSSAALYDKTEVVRWLSSENQSERIGSSFKAHPLTEQMILLTYISEIKEGASPDIKQAIRSSIWRLKNGKWRMVFHQGTPVLRPS